jgi:hypothetical protein
MTANTTPSHGKRAFLLLLLLASFSPATPSIDHGWREIIVPSFDRPALYQSIPGSTTASITVARDAGYDRLDYATTRGAWRWSRERARTRGREWLAAARTEIRRDRHQVIDRILITADTPLLSSIVLTPAFFAKFEPLLGDGFHLIIPDRRTIALYPRLGGRIPPVDASVLLEFNRLSTYPVSREVFRVTRDGLIADGILSED